MKYENYNKVTDLVTKINKEQTFLDEISSDTITVKIHDTYWNRSISIIGPGGANYHDANLSVYVRDFFDAIKTDTKKRIDELKKELEQL